jgi:hypothetical protein
MELGQVKGLRMKATVGAKQTLRRRDWDVGSLILLSNEKTGPRMSGTRVGIFVARAVFFDARVLANAAADNVL